MLVRFRLACCRARLYKYCSWFMFYSLHFIVFYTRDICESSSKETSQIEKTLPKSI